MKRYLIFLLLLGTLFWATGRPLFAQQEAIEPERLDFVSLELWPDYDQPELLVLETVTLPAGAATPASVRLPMPADAALNAVAFQDPASGRLLEITEYQVENGQVTLVTPARSIRLEYYLPMQSSSGERREATFTWTPLYDVNRLEVSVQEPLYGKGMALTPPAAETFVNANGLTYHRLASRTIGAGETILVGLSYALPGGRLTTDGIETAAGTTTTAPQAASPPASDAASSGIWTNLLANWPWLLAAAFFLGVALFMFGLWQRERRRAAALRARKPARRRAACPSCGTPHRPQDRFCHACGEPLK